MVWGLCVCDFVVCWIVVACVSLCLCWVCFDLLVLTFSVWLWLLLGLFALCLCVLMF